MHRFSRIKGSCFSRETSDWRAENDLPAKLTSCQIEEKLMKHPLLTDSRAAINIGFDLSVVPLVPPVRKVALRLSVAPAGGELGASSGGGSR